MGMNFNKLQVHEILWKLYGKFQGIFLNNVESQNYFHAFPL